MVQRCFLAAGQHLGFSRHDTDAIIGNTESHPVCVLDFGSNRYRQRRRVVADGVLDRVLQGGLEISDDSNRDVWHSQQVSKSPFELEDADAKPETRLDGAYLPEIVLEDTVLIGVGARLLAAIETLVGFRLVALLLSVLLRRGNWL